MRWSPRVVVTLTAGKLGIDLYGEIAAVLRMAAGKKASDVPVWVAEQLVVVAGARFVQACTSLELSTSSADPQRMKRC
jgi:hypothetical protein